MIIATGTSRFDTHWKNQDVTWDWLIKHLQNPIHTSETVAEYNAMTNETKKTDIKDVGGFVGGELTLDGHRRKSEILNRTMLTFDIDNGTPELLPEISQITDFNWICYSTHKHTPEHPRVRIVVPLDKAISAEQYEAVIRKIADRYNWMPAIDPRSFSVAQLMYWPSVPKDGTYYFNFYYQNGNNLNAGTVLSSGYTDWQDRRQWPAAPGEHFRLTASVDNRRKDPRENKSEVGLFCRTYTIPDAISTFLSDVYEPTNDSRRYKLSQSSSTAGLQTFGGDNNDLFCCSWHANDPINQEQAGQTVDAFHLVRIHLFGNLDNPETIYKKLSDRPSYTRMCAFVNHDRRCRKAFADEQMELNKNIRQYYWNWSALNNK